MADNIDTRVSAGLHPDNVKAIDGYDEETALVLEPTKCAFDAAYKGISSVFAAREAAATDPTLNDAARVLKTDDLAGTVLTKLTREFDSVRVNLEKGIAHIEKELSAPVTAKAAHSVSSEIRAHVKSLPASERMGFVRAAVESGDEVTASSVLGAPPYLSGIDADMQRTFTRMYHERTSPALAKRLRAMVGAKELVEQRGGLLFTQLEKAVGCVEVRNKEGLVVQRFTPAQLRERKSHADKAFAPQPA